MPLPRVDLAVALVLTVAGVLEAGLGLTSAAAPWYVVATVPFATLPVAALRTRTVTAVATTLSAFLVQSALGSDFPGGATGFVVLVLSAFAAGSVPPPRRSLALLALLLAGVAGVIALGDEPRPGNFVYAGLLVVVAWAAGAALRLTRDRSHLLAEQHAAQERTRIAGELHDVVAHHVTAMVVRAAAARRGRPEEDPAAATLAAIEQEGRETLSQLRAMLGVLRADAHGSLTPQPGLAELPELLQGARESGVTVTFRTTGHPVALDPGRGLTLYRVVQESLTNVRKHSESATVTVSMQWEPSSVRVEVLDPGPARRSGLFTESGLGLRSMAERVSAQGGRLTTGTVGHGFRVAAELPIEPAT